jgi:hypothetical protein
MLQQDYFICAEEEMQQDSFQFILPTVLWNKQDPIQPNWKLSKPHKIHEQKQVVNWDANCKYEFHSKLCILREDKTD